MHESRLGKGTYTDDTQMMIGLAEALLDTPGEVDIDQIAARFAANFDAERGYGGNTERILDAIRQGNTYQQAVDQFGMAGGSYANGAAMRVAPIALAFYPDIERVWQAAAEQAVVTGHTHPIGQGGACIQATAVCHGLKQGISGKPFDGQAFINWAIGRTTVGFDEGLMWVLENLHVDMDGAADALAHESIRADNAVCAALWSVLSSNADAEEAVVRAVNLGGDTDTIGALTGAIVGAYRGIDAFPDRWLNELENDEKGRDYIVNLADRFTVHGTDG